MGCNNILLDYYKQKEKKLGIKVPSSRVQVKCQCADKMA